jgi:hypothetical protein
VSELEREAEVPFTDKVSGLTSWWVPTCTWMDARLKGTIGPRRAEFTATVAGRQENRAWALARDPSIGNA